MKDLAAPLQRIFALLRKIQPLTQEYDVVWQGPYYIPRQGPRRGEWQTSSFMLYRGKLFASLYVSPRLHTLSWTVGSKQVQAEPGLFTGGLLHDAPQWPQVLAQIEHRLKCALRNFPAYNRRVEKQLPLTCRTGKIQRGLSWPKNRKAPLAQREMRRLGRAMNRKEKPALLKAMTLRQYLQVVAIAYDATFKDLRALAPPDKYKRRADGRHGGLLDLPPRDSQAFAKWFNGRSWQGSHPWEIVFGHPHGIMIAPSCDRDTHLWHYSLWVSSEYWYAAAARMAIALAAHAVPFEFCGWQDVTDALQGVDEVEVGPGLRQMHYEELKEERPDAVKSIVWDPVPPLGPIAPDQAARVIEALKRISGRTHR